MQSRPVLRRADLDPLEDLLRSPATTTVGIFAAGNDDAATPRDAIRIARYRRWVSAHVAPPLSEATRRALHQGLPDFLAREAQSRTDAELMLRATLADLHARGELGTAFADPAAIRSALVRLRTSLAREGPVTMFIADGRTLAMLSLSGTLLTFEPPKDVWPVRRLRFGHDEDRPPASLVLWSEGDGPAEPFAGAERVAGGVLSLDIAQPTALTRGA